MPDYQQLPTFMGLDMTICYALAESFSAGCQQEVDARFTD